MSEIKGTISEQLQHLEMLLHRMTFRGYIRSGGKVMPSPYRGQGRVLAALKMRPEISQKELAYLLGMSKQSLAELLGKLDKGGYIIREPSESDRRSITIRLLDKGMEAAEDMDDTKAETFRALDCLNDEELNQFSSYLDRIIRECEEYFPGEGYEERRKKLENFMSHRHSKPDSKEPYGDQYEEEDG